jgi:hypothetical protein
LEWRSVRKGRARIMLFKIRPDSPNMLRRLFGKYYLLIRILLGTLIGILGVQLANYISKRTHCSSARWTYSTGWVCTRPRP